MSTQASFVLRGRNPDVLTCIANLSNDEVFTPPEFANRMLDTLAEALYQSGNRLGALLTIDEAIRLMPNETYFIEQRRRFTGERPDDDRPSPPGSETEGEPPFDEDFELRPIDPDAPYLTI